MLAGIILVTLTLALTCCVSNDAPQYIVHNVYKTIPLNFPDFPEPKENTLIPLDIDGKRVTTKDQEIVNVLVPYWYWALIIRYKVEVDNQEDFYNRCKVIEENKL